MSQQFKEQGNVYFKEKNYEKAIEEYSKAIEIDNNAVYYTNRAACYINLSQIDKAIEDSRKALQLDPKLEKAYTRLEQCYKNSKDHDSLIENYKNWQQIYDQPEKKEEINQKIKEAENQKEKNSQQQQQMMQFMTKLMQNPKTAQYLQEPGFLQKLMMIQQDPMQFQTLSQQDPRIMECLQVITQDFMGQQSNQNFEQNNEPQQKSPPKPEQKQTEQKQPEKELSEADQLKNKGNEYYKQKDFENAIKYYKMAIEKENQPLYYNNMAAVYIELKDYLQAMQSVDTALQVCEDQCIFDFIIRSKLYHRKGTIYQHQNKLQEAIDYLQKSITEKEDYKIKQQLKQLKQQLKNKQQQEYINPEKAKEANEKAKEFFKQGDFKQAIDLYTEAIKRDPSDFNYYNNRGLSYMKFMEWGYARQDLLKALEFKPNIKSYNRLAQCSIAIKEYHKAQDYYQDSLKIEQNVEAQKGLQNVQSLIYNQSHSMSNEDQQKRAEQGMQDPEIRQIVQTPEIQNALKELQTNPQAGMRIMNDPNLGPKIQKLIAAGIIKMG